MLFRAHIVDHVHITLQAIPSSSAANHPWSTSCFPASNQGKGKDFDHDGEEEAARLTHPSISSLLEEACKLRVLSSHSTTRSGSIIASDGHSISMDIHRIYLYIVWWYGGASPTWSRETHTHVMTSPAFQRVSRGWCWVSQKYKMKTLLNLLRFDDGEGERDISARQTTNNNEHYIIITSWEAQHNKV